MVNIYDDLNKLVLNFRKLDEFKALEQAVEQVRADEEAKKALSNIIEEVNRVLFQPIQGMYEGL